ncbi:MAG TPA: hypothetical protein VHK47_13525 [Polyangia bacterium]|jgi:hypothetical protein|nr:hypothetical protein [Polyangia bacterium]
MTRRSSPRASAFVVIVGALFVARCGGNHSLPVQPASGEAGVGGGTTAGASGAAGVGAAGSRADTDGSAGSAAGSGGAGVAGAAGFKGILGEAGSDGGAPDCSTVLCPALTCADGMAPMPDPLSCCPVCKSVKCAGISCPDATPGSCPAGMHPEPSPTQCCESCVVSADLCNEARAQFEQLVGALRDHFGGPCQSDAECTSTAWNNGCSGNCFVPVAKAGAAMFDANLEDSSRTCDMVCGAAAPISCDHMTSVCVQGRCAAKP